jgi:glycosyltransferase involved in cell wall biosynthesis
LKRVERFLIRAFFKSDLSEESLKKNALKEFFIQKNIDVALAEYGPCGYAVKEVCKELQMPLVVHFHGYDAYEHAILKKCNYYQDLWNDASAVIAVSRDMQGQLQHLGFPADKIHYVPYGVDLAMFGGAQPQKAPPMFIAVGRFVDKKAPHLTLLAFKEVLEHVPEARLKMVGDGPLFEACKQLVKSLSMDKAVEFLGTCSHQEIAGLMKQARGFVQHSVKTSYGDSEGTPVAILEAGAAGLPVVATRHAGIPDVVIDQQTGFLVNEGDIAGMAKCILKLARDPALAGKLGAAAQKHIRLDFSLDKNIAELYSVIQKVVKHKPLVSESSHEIYSRV